MIKKMKILHSLLLFVACWSQSFAQQALTQQQAIDEALKNNLMVKSGEYQLAAQKQLKNTAFDLGKTNLMWMHGQFNSILKDNNYTLSQTIPFPTAMASEAKLAQANIVGSEIQLTITQNDLIRQVRSVYNQLTYLIALNKELTLQDSVFSRFAIATQVRYRVGEGTLLEKTTAETQAMEIKNQLSQNESDIAIFQRQLQTLLNSQSEIVPADSLMRIDPAVVTPSVDFNPQLRLIQQEVTIADRTKRVARNKFLPDITVGYFTQSLIGFQEIDNQNIFFDKNKRFTGFELGLAFPLWFLPQQSRTKAAAMNQEAAENKYRFYQNQIEGELQRAQLELAKNRNSLSFYQTNANQNASLILRQAQRAFTEGEIGYLEFLQAVNQARNIRFRYLEILNQYNQSSIQLDYLTGKSVNR